MFDANLQLICWNRRYRELLDLPVAYGQVGVPLSEIFRYQAQRGDFADTDSVEEQVNSRVRRLVVRMEQWQEHLEPSGTVIEVRTDRMPDGGFVVTFSDATNQVRTAQELERSNENLERRVQERTQALERLNSEFERARAEAESANFGKTRFLAAASHDILQPLNAARLYASSLVERDLNEDNGTLARNVDQSLESVEEILGAILDISRLDTGRLKPTISEFRISDILDQLAVEFTPVARDKGLELTIVPCSLTVRSDRRLLARLLQNLVSNAIKYTARGRVLVGCRRGENQLRIAVYDTGLGIPVAKQELIFEEFRRLDEGARQAKGLGLGLSIVERLGRVLEHPVNLVSTPGSGSMFSVEVLIAAPVARAVRKPSAAPVGGQRLKGLTVICIDNEQRILDGMRPLLSGWGCEVFTENSARAAIRLLSRVGSVPDILLVDYHLDDGNGLDAAKSLRSKFGKDLPAILITADRSPQVRDAARERDISVLYKPVKPATLRALMAQRRTVSEAAE